jgi:hypothetical protein
MSGLILPFPRSRDGGFIHRHASLMVGAPTAAKAEAHLQRQLRIQRETLVRRGVDPERIEAELTAIAGNIRAVAWGLMLAPGGAA